MWWWKPTHRNNGEGRCLWGKRASGAPEDSTGVVVTARIYERSSVQQGKSVMEVAWPVPQQQSCEGRSCSARMADGRVVASKAGNSAGAKASCFGTSESKRQQP